MKKKKNFFKILINSLIVCGVIYFLSGPIIEIIGNVLNFTTSSSQGAYNSATFQFQKLLGKDKLINKQKQQITKLKAELKKSKHQINSLSPAQKKVEKLDSLLKLKKERLPKSIAAKVIARSPSSWHKQLLINKGSKSGIKPGLVVITPKGILGQIQETKPHFSIVQLLSSSQVKFGALIERTGVLGIIQGDSDGYAQLQFVPIGSDIQQGDVVETTEISPVGLKKLYPTGYPVGEVVSLTRLKNNSEMFIKVKLFEDASSTTEVLVLLLH